jgi:hypothetical protein
VAGFFDLLGQQMDRIPAASTVAADLEDQNAIDAVA